MLSVEVIRNKILQVITKHEPKNIESIDTLMKKWETKENDLFKLLCEKHEEKWIETPIASLKQTYIIGTKIGIGAFSTVRKCKRKDNGRIFALKIINKKKYDAADLIMIHHEVSIMRQISHPNIVTLYDVFNSNSKTCLVIDLFVGGTLFDRINEKDLSEKESCKIFSEMIDAMKYLHNKNIVHRDIKCENFVFVSNDEHATIKLIDFGFARNCSNIPLKTQCGTPIYSAPELLMGLPYGCESDMWGIGVILYIMLCGNLPFADENEQRLYKKVLNAKYEMSSLAWNKISQNAKNVVVNLLQSNPRKRLSAKQAMEHIWLKKYVNVAVVYEVKSKPILQESLTKSCKENIASVTNK